MSAHKARRPHHQVTLVLLPGSEPWVQVTTIWGTFKLPWGAPIGEVLMGVDEHWTGAHQPNRDAEIYVRVPLSLAKSHGLL